MDWTSSTLLSFLRRAVSVFPFREALGFGNFCLGLGSGVRARSVYSQISHWFGGRDTLLPVSDPLSGVCSPLDFPCSRRDAGLRRVRVVDRLRFDGPISAVLPLTVFALVDLAIYIKRIWVGKSLQRRYVRFRDITCIT